MLQKMPTKPLEPVPTTLPDASKTPYQGLAEDLVGIVDDIPEAIDRATDWLHSQIDRDRIPDALEKWLIRTPLRFLYRLSKRRLIAA